MIASVEKINSKREKDYLQNYFTCVNEYCVAIRVLQYNSFQEGSNFLLKCEIQVGGGGWWGRVRGKQFKKQLLNITALMTRLERNFPCPYLFCQV